MNDESIKLYELLGVAPGASVQELKAAHRDLAKVWHPDRFAHDPRLQQKAQEKLKEINEAYDRLKSRKAGRRTPASYPTEQSSPPPQPTPRRTDWKFILLPVMAFVLIFFAAFRVLIPSGAQNKRNTATPDGQAQAPLKEEAQQSESTIGFPVVESSPGKRANQQSLGEARTEGTVSSKQDARQQVRPLPTVTLTIDPVSGMIARPDCPMKSRMTYPSGAEPSQYCNVSHQSDAPAQTDQTRPKESRLKSFAKRLASPARLFGGKDGQDDGSKEVKSTDASVP